ncbi:MAG: CotH kinase family protein [Bacteroidota bacterium]
MLRTLQLSLIMVLFNLSGWSQDPLPAQLDRDTVLTSTGSPYYIQQNLTIPAGITMEIRPGVEVFLSQGVSITIQGKLKVNGTAEDRVLFTTGSAGVRWRYISNSGSLFAKHLVIRRAVRFVTSYGDTVVIDHCDVDDTYGSTGDDCIGVHNAKKVLVCDSRIIGNPAASRIDGLDLDNISDDTVSGNFISGFADDGIDIGEGSKNIVIENNVIDNCDMAVSIGESSTVLVRKNLLTNSTGGIQSHTGAVTTAQQNTLYGNGYGLWALHYTNQLTSGGTIHISNSIISNSLQRDTLTVSNSVVEFEYCMTDSAVMPGPGNISGDPMFVNAAQAVFELSPGSAAIDAGNPDNDGDGLDFSVDPDDTDPDGSRLDLGAFPYYHSALKIIEIAPSNLSLMQNDSGEYTDWFKVVNRTDSTINMNGMYLSDRCDNPLKYRLHEALYLPAGDTVLFWANNTVFPSGNLLPFKLSGEGESLVLSDSKGVVMDKVTFPRIPVNYLYIRDEVSGRWLFSTYPADENALTYDSLSNNPVFSNPGGVSAFPVTVSLSTEDPEDSIYYTTNGGDPAGGNLYASELAINEAVTLRSNIHNTDYLPGYIHAAAYFAPEMYHLPVVSLSTNEEHLFGPTGISTNCWSGGPKWERPASFSYYGEQTNFSSIAGIRIQGGNSVCMPKQAFRLHFRGGYGNSELEATPFEKGPSSFKNLVLRSGYDDDITTSTGTLLRDPFTCELWNDLGELATESDFGVLLLNNNYWGIYNIRESINEHFVADYIGTEDFDLVRFQKWGADLKYGSMTTWNQLVSYFDSTDFTRPEVYDEVSAFMEMNSLLNLLSLVHCSQFRSWTWGAFAIKPVGGKWSWAIWDTDRSYTTLTWNGFTEYANTSAEKWPNFIPQKLIQNQQFKEALINRNCDLLNSIFIPDSAIAVYDSLAAVIAPEIDAEYERWKPGYRSRWDTNNENIRNFLRERPSYLYDQMKSYFGIEDTVRITLRIVGDGKVQLNSLLLDQEEWRGVYMSGVPITMDAIPASGGSFIEWRGISNLQHIEVDPDGNREIVAVFDTTTVQEQKPVVINEIMYHPLNSLNSEWFELYNPNNFNLSLEGFVCNDGGVDNRFVFPANAAIDPLGFIIVAGDSEAFRTEFGSSVNVTGNFNMGVNGFNLSNEGETIYLKNGSGEVEDYVQYDDVAPWPVYAAGYGPSIQLIATDLDNNTASNWYASRWAQFSPGDHNMGNSNEENSQVLKQQSVKLYPNPVGATLYLDIQGVVESEMEVRVFTLTGVQVTSAIFHPSDHQGTISWNHGITKPGAYVLKVAGNSPESNLNHAQLLIIN